MAYFTRVTDGNWTPTIVDENLNPNEGQQYVEQTGRYTRIGREVFFEGRVRMSNRGGLSGSRVYIGGLPFTAAGPGCALVGAGTGLVNVSDESITGVVEGNAIRLKVWSGITGTPDLSVDKISGAVDLTFTGRYTV